MTFICDVVIPSFKRTDALENAVKSALAQGEFLGKVIVIDDASPNQIDIGNMLKRLNDPKVLFVPNQHKSNAAQTRNQGIDLSVSPWVAFLDSDDVFLPGKLKAISQAVIDNPEANVFYNKALTFFDGMQDGVVPVRFKNDSESVSDYLFAHGQMLQTSTLVASRELLRRARFNPAYKRHQDYDLCLSFDQCQARFVGVDFVGTAIFWNSDERPQDKGESVAYSHQWLDENRYRLSDDACKAFYWQFVVMKSVRQGMKCESLSLIKALSLKDVGIRSLFVYFSLLLLPSIFYRRCYVFYKHARCKIYSMRQSGDAS